MRNNIVALASKPRGLARDLSRALLRYGRTQDIMPKYLRSSQRPIWIIDFVLANPSPSSRHFIWRPSAFLSQSHFLYCFFDYYRSQVRLGPLWPSFPHRRADCDWSLGDWQVLEWQTWWELVRMVGCL